MIRFYSVYIAHFVVMYATNPTVVLKNKTLIHDLDIDLELGSSKHLIQQASKRCLPITLATRVAFDPTHHDWNTLIPV